MCVCGILNLHISLFFMIAVTVKGLVIGTSNVSYP